MMIVAPFVGAWIEILTIIFTGAMMSVAPFVGAWIEIVMDIQRPVDR